MNFKNLVILPLSDTNCSMADCWATHGRQYDLLVNNYGTEGFFKDRNPEFYFEIKDHKFRTVKHIFQQNYHLLKNYEFVMIPDPDLQIQGKDINNLFSFAKNYNLDLCQPSQTGHVSWPLSKPDPDKNIAIKHLNIIEPMCPIFSKKALMSCMWTFDFSFSSWGLDFVWPELVWNENKNNVGIINCISVDHTRPCISKDAIFSNGKTAWEEFDDSEKAFGYTRKCELLFLTRNHSFNSSKML